MRVAYQCRRVYAGIRPTVQGIASAESPDPSFICNRVTQSARFSPHYSADTKDLATEYCSYLKCGYLPKFLNKRLMNHELDDGDIVGDHLSTGHDHVHSIFEVIIHGGLRRITSNLHPWILAVFIRINI